MSKYMREIDGEELKDLIAEGKTVVCDFWATWCMPCRMLSPVMETLAEEFAGKAEFVKVNIDESAATAAEFGVMSIPDVYIFQNGEVAAHNLGYVPEQQMREFLSENL